MNEIEETLRLAREVMAGVIRNSRQGFTQGQPVPEAAHMLGWIKATVEQTTKCAVICGPENHDVATLHPFAGPIFAQIEVAPDTHRVVRFLNNRVW